MKETLSVRQSSLEFLPLEVPVAPVSDFIVQGPCRGQGVGEWFMARIEAHCVKQGIPRLLLTPVADSQGFCEKLHFGADPLVAGFLRKESLSLQRRPLPFWG